MQSNLASTAATIIPSKLLGLLRCPISGELLHQEGDQLITQSGTYSYRISAVGIPLFAEKVVSEEARIQQAHYDRIVDDYLENLSQSYTQEYVNYLDEAFLDQVDFTRLENVAEICCGRGEALLLLQEKMVQGIGLDISNTMLEVARRELPQPTLFFVQGDATMLPLIDETFDSVFLFGGIHHVNDRERLFAQVWRVLKPNGLLYWREPVNDFFVWRWLRAIIYRLSPNLDEGTEHPLRRRETIAQLEHSGFRVDFWQTFGFLGFCLLMNSDVLIFNRVFRFIPGIRRITRWMTKIDELSVRVLGRNYAGLQVVGRAVKVQPNASPHDI